MAGKRRVLPVKEKTYQAVKQVAEYKGWSLGEATERILTGKLEALQIDFAELTQPKPKPKPPALVYGGANDKPDYEGATYVHLPWLGAWIRADKG